MSKVIATLTLEIEYDDVPSEQELQEVIEKAQELGGVTRATFCTLAPVEKELVPPKKLARLSAK